MNEALKYIDAKIYDTNKVINRIIEENLDDRDYLSKNVLSNLRYLVEYCFFRVYIIEKEKKYIKFNHDNNKASIKYMKSCANMRELRALYGFLQISTSHPLPNVADNINIINILHNCTVLIFFIWNHRYYISLSF